MLRDQGRTTCMMHNSGDHMHELGEDTLQERTDSTNVEDSYGQWVVVTRKRSGNNSPKKVSGYASLASKKNDSIAFSNGALAKVGTTSKATGAKMGQKKDGKRKVGPLMIGKSFNGLVGLGHDIELNRIVLLSKSKGADYVKGKKVLAHSRASVNLANRLS